MMSLADLLRLLSTFAGLPAVIVAGVAAATIVIARDWRLLLFAYALLSVMLSLLLSQVIPIEWALLQTIVGGLNAVMLFLSARQLHWGLPRGIYREAQWPQMASLTIFRVLAVALAAVAFFALRSRVQLPMISPLFRDAVFWLGIVSLLGLALTEEPLHAGLALLTLLGGFQLLLSSLIQRRLLLGVTEGGQLLLGLAISYLVLSHGLAMPEPGDAEEPT